jgi:putative SbcD/Mre11-related phosphoesterase
MRSLPIAPGLELIDLALFLSKTQTLAIADVHLGLEDALREEGILIPRQHVAHVQQRLERIVRALNITPSAPLKRIIINGDLRHQFGPLSRIESKESKEFLRWLTSWAKQIILIKGNHDGSLAQFVSPQVTIAKSYREEHCWFVHGDEAFTLPTAPRSCQEKERPGMRATEWIVIGHEHPAVSLRDPVTERVEVYKCFLAGRFQERNLLVLPSFNQLVRGSDLTKEQPLSPLVHQSSLEDLLVYPVSDDGRIYEFGPLHRLLAAV